MPVPAFVRRLAGKWKINRKKFLVTCPENHSPAGVDLVAFHQLSTCTRWPEHAGCGQQCLAQIEAAPHDCQVRTILEKWYEGKSCVVCRQPFGKIHWAVQKPALLRADKVSVEWNQIQIERLPEMLESCLPVCFACHMATTLVREHPDLVVYRPPRSQ